MYILLFKMGCAFSSSANKLCVKCGIPTFDTETCAICERANPILIPKNQKSYDEACKSYRPTGIVLVL